jgi:hypothetical protein
MNGAAPREFREDEPKDEITSIRGSGPIITLPPNPKYRAYYVLEPQLKLIAGGGGEHHLSFASIATGAFFTALTTLMAVDLHQTHPRFFVVCVALTFVSGFAAPISGLLWVRQRRLVKGVLDELRSQYRETDKPTD